MCEFSGKLIAWLDHELSTEEAAEVERHVEDCSECRSGADAYKRVSIDFEKYCDEILALDTPRKIPRWVPVISGVGAVAALVALILALPRTHVEPPAYHAPQVAVAASPAIVAKTLPAPVAAIHRVHRRQAIAPAQDQNETSALAQNQYSYTPADEPVIQIAIPADEMFPPGAVPEGMNFAADLTIAPDGSAERLRLRPRLAGFERSTTQP